MPYESDHISSQHGQQLHKHIADQDLFVSVCERDRTRECSVGVFEEEPENTGDDVQ